MVWLRCRTAICREEDWDDPVLAERKAEIRVAGDLKDELSVPAFVQQLVERQTPDGQAAENGWARGETQTLIQGRFADALLGFETVLAGFTLVGVRRHWGWPAS
jgi:hypothetical protein